MGTRTFRHCLALDRDNPMVQQWEALMSRYQKTLPWAKPGEKWLAMERIFRLTDCLAPAEQNTRNRNSPA